MCGGSGGAPPPPPLDPKAQELEQKQIDLLNRQSMQQEAFQGLQAEQYGYEPIFSQNPVYNDPHKANYGHRLQELKEGTRGNPNDPTDNIAYISKFLQDNPTQIVTGYKKSESRSKQDTSVAELQSAQMETAKRANAALNKYLDSLDTDDYQAYQAAQQELQAQQTEIALQQGERQKKALKGELPLSEGTIARKAQDFQLLKENLARGGNSIIGDDPGSAYSLTSPGDQALKAFNSRYSAVEDMERRGELDSGSSNYLQAVGLTGNLGKTDLNTVGQLSNPGGYASTSSSLTPGSSPVTNNLSLVQGYGAAMNPFLQQQQMQWQTGQTNAGIKAQNQAGWMSLAGTALGVGAGTAALMSSRKMKKNIEAIKSEKDATTALAKTPVYRWNYKHEPDGFKKHLGTMTDEAPEDVLTDDGDHLDIASYMGLITLSTRDLHNRVLSLEGKRS